MVLSRLGFPLSLMLAILFISVPTTTPATTLGDKTSQVQLDESERRKALWKALLQACPEEYREIDVYAENSSLTQVCFRSKGVTLLFDMRRQKVEVQRHAKVLPRINRITFRENGSNGVFILWYYGQQELSIAVGK